MTRFTSTLSSYSFSHRPLNWLALASIAGAIIVGVFYLFDTRELLGVSLWEKPLKFLLSTVVYALTFSWFAGLITKRQRLVWWLGTLIALMLAIELIIIIGLASAGLTSHFNVSNGFHIAMWSIMASGISILWFLSFAVGAFLWNSQTITAVLRNAIRWGLSIGLAGMGLAFTMTSPNPEQLSNFEGIAGAHTVGASDGGPGLPFLGWSTVGGDLRIAHFLGLHGLQFMPLIGLWLIASIASVRLQRALLHGAGVTYALLVVTVYIQALAGESIVAPSALTIVGLVTSVGVGLLTGTVVFLNAQTSPRITR